MFTGIITDVGRVLDVEQRGDARFRIACGYDLAAVDIGASICCAGVCLTATEKNVADGWFAVDVSAETLSKSTLEEWTAGRRVNLERSLRVGDELGGHIVSGHVDGVGRVAAMRQEGDSTRVEIEVPANLAPFIAPKGSIAIDGCSLTVNEVVDGAAPRFGVNLIPHTKAHTTFDDLSQDRRVNLEIDVLARYVARLKQSLDGS